MLHDIKPSVLSVRPPHRQWLNVWTDRQLGI